MSEERGEWTGLTFEQRKTAVEVIGVIVEDWDEGMREIFGKAYEEGGWAICRGGGVQLRNACVVTTVRSLLMRMRGSGLNGSTIRSGRERVPRVRTFCREGSRIVRSGSRQKVTKILTCCFLLLGCQQKRC